MPEGERSAPAGHTASLERSRPDAVARLLVHRDWLAGFANRVVPHAELAQELVQETWVSAVTHPPGRLNSARGWLRAVLLNHLRMHARRNFVEGQGRGFVEERHPRASPALERVERREVRRWLARRVRALPEPYRSTLVLRYFRDHEPSEIARRLGIPAGTVRWRLKRGLDRLRHQVAGSRAP